MLQAQGTRHVLGVARALNFRNGYFDQTAEVWGDDWQLLASSHQLVDYRDWMTAPRSPATPRRWSEITALTRACEPARRARGAAWSRRSAW